MDAVMLDCKSETLLEGTAWLNSSSLVMFCTGQQAGDGGFRIITDLPPNQQRNAFTYTAGRTYQSELLAYMVSMANSSLN